MKTMPDSIRSRACARSRRGQGGFILVTCVLVMVVMALLALSMFRSMGVQERIAGVIRDKQSALTAAVTAEEYAEWWLLQPNASTTAVACTTGFTITVTGVSSPQVCSLATALANPQTLPWGGASSNSGNIYTPPGMTISTSGGTTTNYAAPGFYITYLGTKAQGVIYQIDAYGFGGSGTTVAVVQSTYVVNSGGVDSGQVRRTGSQN